MWNGCAKENGESQRRLGDRSAPDANLILSQGEKKQRLGRRKFGWEPCILQYSQQKVQLLVSHFTKAVGESLYQSWPTKESFVFLGRSALVFPLHLTQWLEPPVRLMSSVQTLKRVLKSNSWDIMYPVVGSAIGTFSWLQPPPKRHLQTCPLPWFLLLCCKLPSGKFSLSNLLTSQIQWFSAFQNEHIGCPNSYLHSPKYQRQSLPLSFAF